MAALDALRPSGWSYWAGYSHDYKAFVARAWKTREKPVKVRAQGGADVILSTYAVSAQAGTLEEAARECAARAELNIGKGYWWEGLPVTRVNG